MKIQLTALILFSTIFILFISTNYSKADVGDQQKKDTKNNSTQESHSGEHHHHEKKSTHISASIATQVGIGVGIAGSQLLRQTSVSYGRLNSSPEQVSHVRARFSGVISSVKATIGDEVKAGDILAQVESNESLKKYNIIAPITGTIVQRHANVGEVTREQVLFSISNVELLWAELRIFPSQNRAITAGQEVRIQVGKENFESVIEDLLPVLENPHYLIARAKLTNIRPRLFPGLMAEGAIVVDKFDVDVAVAKDALHKMNNEIGVFVKGDNEEYAFTPLILGRNDDRYSEVISGLDRGTTYVTKNSYLIKADIEKSQAEHVH